MSKHHKYFNQSNILPSLILPTFFMLFSIWLSTQTQMCNGLQDVEKCVEGLEKTPFILGIPVSITFFFLGCRLILLKQNWITPGFRLFKVAGPIFKSGGQIL